MSRLKVRARFLNQAAQHWYSTGSGSDRAPFGECVSVGARSLPLPVLYHRMYQCCLVRFRWSRTLTPNLMSEIVIRAETLGKKYRISRHGQRQRYAALRDAIAEK